MSTFTQDPAVTEIPSPTEAPLVAQTAGACRSQPRDPAWVFGCATCVISAGISVLIILFLYQPVRVEGTSMLPRLEDHDRLFINKFVYHITSIDRGDVVVFHYPRDPEKSYIKRVIALPGDTPAHRSRTGVGERQGTDGELCSGDVPRYALVCARRSFPTTAIS